MCLSPGAAARAQQCAGLPGVGALLVGQAALEAALETLEALAIMISKTPGLFCLTLELVLSEAQDCKVLYQMVALVALDALEALALMPAAR